MALLVASSCGRGKRDCVGASSRDVRGKDHERNCVGATVVQAAVNATLSSREVDALLEVLERGLVEIRLAAMGGQTKRAEAIADGLHNLPRLLLEGERRAWSVARFRELFLAPLLAEHPDLVVLQEPLDRP